MNDINPCIKVKSKNETIHCHICKKPLDYDSAFFPFSEESSIHVCFESIKQKIFVYGKYCLGKYGALRFDKYFTKEECSKKVCEDDIKNFLKDSQLQEYSRRITCTRGNMEAILLTTNIIEKRKADLNSGKLDKFFKETGEERKYYCSEDAAKLNNRCLCGEKLIKVGSLEYSELTGMNDLEFAKKYFPQILKM